MYVIANNVDSVEFFVNGVSRGKVTQPENGYVYAFPNIAFTPGTIKAVGYKGGVAAVQHELKTAGAPAAIKLTLHTAPGGLRADGEDVALIDFEVVDAERRALPHRRRPRRFHLGVGGEDCFRHRPRHLARRL